MPIPNMEREYFPLRTRGHTWMNILFAFDNNYQIRR